MPQAVIYLTVAETCALLGLSPQTVRKVVDAGDLPCRRTVGGHRRFVESDVLAFRAHRAREPREDALRAAVWTSALLALLSDAEEDVGDSPLVSRFRAAAAELRRP